MRQGLAASPADVNLATSLARADIARYRTLSDPRYLGRAQATLARWWNVPDAAPDVLLLRATIRQSLHDFGGARADLDRLVQVQPSAQAHLTRAVVATVTADYAAARASCAALPAFASALVVATCTAPLDALAGNPTEARAALERVLAAAPDAEVPIRTWALTTIAELAVMEGQSEIARLRLRDVLALDDGDVYARNLLADLSPPSEASRLLAAREHIDSHLVRRAIAEYRTRGPDRARLVAAMRTQIAEAAMRGDRIHLREEAMFALAVEHDVSRAVALATDNWQVQKELADARLLAEAALAARDREAARPVVEWAARVGVRDATLDAALAALERAR